MRRRGLAPEEAALWARVAASVRPLFGHRPPDLPAAAPAPLEPPAPSPRVAARPPAPKPRPGPPANTLDGGWDRKLAKGLAQPDMVIDLHGHTLAAAHAALDHGLDRARSQGARLVLLIAGRPPKGDWSGHEPRRGAIRAAVPDWLAASRHADTIAAVRHAHPRHGGQGALYVVMRRAR